MKVKMNYQRPDKRIIEHLRKLQVVEPRDSNAAARGRDQFLLQAQRFGAMAPTKREGRREGWANILVARIRLLPMPTLLIIFLAILFVSGGGVAVFAAQESLPNQPLYGLKMVTEDVQLGLTNGDQARMNLSLHFSDRRMDEMVYMVGQDYPVPEVVATRYEENVDEAMYLIAQLPDDEIMNALSEAEQHLHTQEQTIRKAMGVQPTDLVIKRVHNRMQLRIEQIEDGMHDPNSFRRQFLTGDAREFNGDPYDSSSGDADGTEDPAIFPDLEHTVATPDSLNGDSQPRRTNTPSHNRFMEPYPDEDLNETGESQQPWITGTPSTGNGYGTGPDTKDGECVNCDPDNDWTGPKDDSGHDSNDDRKNEGGQPGMNTPDGGGDGGGKGAGDHGGGGEMP